MPGNELGARNAKVMVATMSLFTFTQRTLIVFFGGILEITKDRNYHVRLG